MFRSLPSSLPSSRAASPAVGFTVVPPLVLVVAEDPRAQHVLVSALAIHGVRAIGVGLAAPSAIRAVGHGPDLVVFDWNRPSVDGVGITFRLRRSTGAPILVITEHPEDAVRAGVLEAGASDCLRASAGASAQVSRILSYLRRQGQASAFGFATERVRCRLHFDRGRRVLFVDGSEIHMTPMECRLATVLTEALASAVPEERLFQMLWGVGRAFQPQYLRTLVRQLRHKIERDPSRPAHLVGSPGAGYRLKLG